MKILILANNDVGLYQFRKELIKELLRENAVLISLPYGGMIDQLKKLGCIYINTDVDRRGINPIKDLKLLEQYSKIIKEEKPDLVITYTIKPNIYGGLVCRLRKVPYVVNVTGLGTAFQERNWLHKVVTLMYRVGLKNAKTIFFENEENQQIFISEKIIIREKTCLLNGAGVNLEHYQVAEYPPNEGATKFLFIGRIMKEKGINELFLAMKKMIADGYNVELNILGEFEEDYREKIQQYVNDGWLHYYGYQKDVRPFIARTQCFVLPSWHEGMANTNLECAAMGRPVITSNIHGCLEAVDEENSGFLCIKQDAESLYTAMCKFMHLSYEARKRMGLAGRKHMEENFDKCLVVKRTIEELIR